ncbi:hypothetical protein QVD17_31476 [Tagetes erecta]|uniref:Uncharacterized protein n=1 Tax=Tagetes erecta TaxID=13708 RepID=A0AAD8K730_TARER|nr:hypothetical protein QVD17_31476 [Tagetes erecta]
MRKCKSYVQKSFFVSSQLRNNTNFVTLTTPPVQGNIPPQTSSFHQSTNKHTSSSPRVFITPHLQTHLHLTLQDPIGLLEPSFTNTTTN